MATKPLFIIETANDLQGPWAAAGGKRGYKLASNAHQVAEKIWLEQGRRVYVQVRRRTGTRAVHLLRPLAI